MLLTTAIFISMYDLPHDMKHVVIEACQNEACVRVVAPKSQLEDQAALDNILNLIRSKLLNTAE